MARLSWTRGLRAGAFVALAVVLTLAVEALLHRSPAGPRFVGPGAAPPAAQPATQAHVFNSTADPATVAAAASGASGSALTPLPAAAFARPIARYRAYARGEAAVLASRVSTLTGALRAGDRGRAEAAWRRADSAFQRVGAAYGSLGPLGDALDGDAGGLPGGVRDPHWRGLRQIEYGLWSGQAPRSLAPAGRALQADVARLRRALPTLEITPLDYATRAHEILEDVQRDRLGKPTPSDDGVRATADGLAATRVVLGTLAHVLSGRGDAQTRSRFWLRRLGATLAAIRAAHHGYPPAARLTRGERERLQGRLGATLEALSGIPGELETQLPPRIPRIGR